jgi:hypothetical protein
MDLSISLELHLRFALRTGQFTLERSRRDGTHRTGYLVDPRAYPDVAAKKTTLSLPGIKPRSSVQPVATRRSGS